MFAPGRPLRLVSSRALGLAIPAAALVAGVTIAQLGGGADFLTALAAVATPLLAVGAGWARGWRFPWLPALCVPPLYAVAWLRPEAWSSDLAGVVLIAGACLAITGLVAGVAPRSWLTAGLVLLVVLDVILVWGRAGAARTARPAAIRRRGRHGPRGRPLGAAASGDIADCSDPTCAGRSDRGAEGSRSIANPVAGSKLSLPRDCA